MERIVDEPQKGTWTGYPSSDRDDPTNETGLNIHISISYKTLLVVFALFGLTERIVSALIDSF